MSMSPRHEVESLIKSIEVPEPDDHKDEALERFLEDELFSSDPTPIEQSRVEHPS